MSGRYSRARNNARHRVISSIRNRVVPAPPPGRRPPRRVRRRGPGRGGAGSAALLRVPSGPPAISRLEVDLGKLGVDIQQYRQFRSQERVKVLPKSGHCYWYCVPTHMEYGNPMAVVDYGALVAGQGGVVKQSPNTCDLYDIYKNITAGLGPSTANNFAATTFGGDTSQNPDLRLASGYEGIHGRYLQMPYGVQRTDTTLAQQIPTGLRVVKPGMDYTMKTHINYDNVSSLDAFVEVYKLTYRPPLSGWTGTGYQLGSDYHISTLHALGRMGRMPLIWAGTNGSHPGPEFCPISTVTSDPEARSAGALFGSGLLKAYCDAVIYQRTAPYSTTVTGYTGEDTGTHSGDFMGVGIGASTMTAIPHGQWETIHLNPAGEGGTQGTNSAGRGSMSFPEQRKQIVCHPKVDPLKVTPKGRPVSDLGFTMERVQGPRRIKPGGHARFQIPNKGVRHWEYAKSPLGREDQNTETVVGVDKTVKAGYAEVYCFRVWGDMIHAKTPLASGFETDFQTGSTCLTFETQRVCWARVRPKVNTVVNPVLMPFDADVALDQQEQINEESDRPELIMHAGDGVVNP